MAEVSRSGPDPAGLVFDVDRQAAVTDVAVRIRLRGAPPRAPVTITATLRFESGGRCRSQATFTADERGLVDVAAQAPTSGSYDGIAPMGLIWSAERVPGDVQPVPADTVMRPWLVDLEAEAPGGLRARTTLERYIAGPGVTRHVVRDDGLVATLLLPPGTGPHPAVIVLGGGGGGLNEELAAIFASHGYGALALAYFRAEALPRGLVNLPLEYFERAIRWMRAQPWLRDGFLAVRGVSRGGELALLLGATFPDIDAVIAWVPSGVVFWPLGLPEPGDPRPAAAWTYRGRPFPYLQEGNPGDRTLIADRSGPIAFTPFYRSQLRDARAVERATIAVERIRGPVLLVSGTDDQMWPSSDLADIAMRRLEERGHPFPHRHLRYEGAGHLIPVPYIPTTVRVLGLAVEGAQDPLLLQGGTPKADAEAGIDAWAETLRFLEAAVAARERARPDRSGPPASD